MKVFFIFMNISYITSYGNNITMEKSIGFLSREPGDVIFQVGQQKYIIAALF